VKIPSIMRERCNNLTTVVSSYQISAAKSKIWRSMARSQRLRSSTHKAVPPSVQPLATSIMFGAHLTAVGKPA